MDLCRISGLLFKHNPCQLFPKYQAEIEPNSTSRLSSEIMLGVTPGSVLRTRTLPMGCGSVVLVGKWPFRSRRPYRPRQPLWRAAVLGRQGGTSGTPCAHGQGQEGGGDGGNSRAQCLQCTATCSKDSNVLISRLKAVFISGYAETKHRRQPGAWEMQQQV
jgi:hypothetical protein